MKSVFASSYTSFDGYRRLAGGTLDAVALAVKRAVAKGAVGPILVFDDGSGQQIDIDTRGTDKEVASRYAHAGAMDAGKRNVSRDLAVPSANDLSGSSLSGDQVRGRGRPKLGVVSREVTLLPRHWEWLAAQPGGASVALRKLVEEARRVHGHKDKLRKAHERTYSFMSAMAGNLAGFEDAARALFADDRLKLESCIENWPQDVRKHVIWLVSDDGMQSTPATSAKKKPA